MGLVCTAKSKNDCMEMATSVITHKGYPLAPKDYQTPKRSHCGLCGKGNKYANHLFIHCPKVKNLEACGGAILEKPPAEFNNGGILEFLIHNSSQKDLEFAAHIQWNI